MLRRQEPVGLPLDTYGSMRGVESKQIAPYEPEQSLLMEFRGEAIEFPLVPGMVPRTPYVSTAMVCPSGRPSGRAGSAPPGARGLSIT